MKDRTIHSQFRNLFQKTGPRSYMRVLGNTETGDITIVYNNDDRHPIYHGTISTSIALEVLQCLKDLGLQIQEASGGAYEAKYFNPSYHY